MRTLFILAFLTACSEPEPRAPLVSSRVATGETIYTCSDDGAESLVYVTRDGERLTPRPTGRSCDPEAYAEFERTHGPVTARERMIQFYAEWRAGET